MATEETRVSAFCDDALGAMDGVEIARMIAEGELSAREAVDAAIERARKVNPVLNAIVTDTFQLARKQAEQKRTGALAGVPVFIKDTDDAPGAPTLFGSRAAPAKVKQSASPFVEQLLSLGVISLGKSTLPELGLTATTEPLLTGPTRNPWNPRHIAGGSSGGSAALVAAGVVPIAHGNDGGGSLRIPAACCGLVGLKPTRDRLLNVSGSELMPINIIHQGILSRSVRDTAAFYAGAEKFYRNPRLPEIGSVLHPGEKRLRIALYTDTPFGEPSHPEAAGPVEETGKLCQQLGHAVEEITCPYDGGMAWDFILYWGMMAFSMHHFGGVTVTRGFDGSRLEELTLGLSRYYLKNFWRTPRALNRYRVFMKRISDLFEKYDLLLSPTLSHSPPEIGYLGPEVPFDTALQRLTKYVAFTPAHNISGAPAVSLPLGSTADGLPMGVQFAAASGNERTLLEIAYELEQVRPWARV